MAEPGTPARRGHEARLKRSILYRAAVVAWIGVILSLGLFILFIIPAQREMLYERLESTAEVVATSIDQITVTSIVVEDYSPVIEHCMKVVQDRPAVLYLVIARRDGFSLVHTADGWSYETQPEHWEGKSSAFGQFGTSELTEGEIFHYSHPLHYSGIDWGWIHIGLSLEQFERDLNGIYYQTGILGLLCLAAAFLVSLYFARQLIKPIRELSDATQRVADGDLSARAAIATGDEVEHLAHAFNRMAHSLQLGQAELEQRVADRTTELTRANEELKEEINERQLAERARRAAERELETQQALSVRSDRLRSLGEMAAGMAHELNQPLMGVRGLAEHMLIGQDRGWELTTAQFCDRLQRIIEQADRMVHIIEHIRMFARQAGKPERSKVDINDVVRSATDLLGVQFRSHGLELDCDLGQDLPAVSANAFSLEEVLLNLLNNARDAVEEDRAQGKSPRVVVRTRANGIADAPAVRIEVIDTGHGIPEDVMAKVFDPFYTTKDPDKGTGLGLSISRSIVAELEGSLRMESAVGRGTTAIISLPARVEDEAVEEEGVAER